MAWWEGGECISSQAQCEQFHRLAPEGQEWESGWGHRWVPQKHFEAMKMGEEAREQKPSPESTTIWRQEEAETPARVVKRLGNLGRARKLSAGEYVQRDWRSR